MGNHVHVKLHVIYAIHFITFFFVKIPTICTIHLIILKFSHIQYIFRHVLVVATTVFR